MKENDMAKDTYKKSIYFTVAISFKFLNKSWRCEERLT